MSNFLVYKSSAGSGKTYTLMMEYLSIALKNTGAYSRILAITFTNKAANEIKQRILDTLERIATTTPGNIPEKDIKLFEKLIENTGLAEDAIIANAGKVLTSILHHYSDFAISTIDSFMHRIIRSFAFDFKLSMNFEVELDTKRLLHTAVDEMISKVGLEYELTEILRRYVIRKAEEDENWDLSNDLKKTAASLLKEKMAGLMEVLDARSLTLDDYGKIRQVHNNLTDALKAEGNRVINLIHKAGFEPTDFTQGERGIAKLYLTAARGESCGRSSYIDDAVNQGKWLKSKSPLQEMVNAIEHDLVHGAKEILKLNASIKLVDLIIKNFHPTLLLKRINDELDDIRKQRNIISINDFNTLINKLIKETSVPFIYERVGEKYNHYMIDEFQDTSEMQWNNLLPLFENSLAAGHRNMIVGDGKQAIYRFKNGNAIQFVQLPKLTGSDTDLEIRARENFLKDHFRQEPLNNNWRSRKEIVDFNNAFFAYAAPRMVNEHIEFYKDVEQGCDAAKTGGLVSLHKTEPDNIISTIVEIIYKAKEDGYAYGDIAVLCRRNIDAIVVAEALQLEGIGVVSSESLLLSNAQEVNFLMNWVGLMANTDDKIYLQAIISYLLINYDALSAYNILRKPEKAYLHELLGVLDVKIRMGYFSVLSFYDAMELIAREFRLYDHNSVYIRTFMDRILEFTQRKSTGAVGFLEYWEENKSKWSISLPVQKDSVQILTVHKSKGLDFPVVIYAYPDLKSSHTDLTWSNIRINSGADDSAAIEEYTMPLVFENSKALEGTSLEQEYTSEKQMACLDKFNLYYVALTRAAERLYIVYEASEKIKDPPEKLQDLLPAFISLQGEKEVFGDGTWVMGKYKDSTIHESENTPQLDLTRLETGDWHGRVMLAKRSVSDWSKVRNALKANNGTSEDDKLLHGNLVHLVLSLIDDFSELPIAMEEALKQYEICDSGTREKLSATLDKLMQMPECLKFFSEGNVIKEKEIIDSSGNIYRPDRIVLQKNATYIVDYKTGLHSDKHVSQVTTYMKIISAMGYPKPQGFILYMGDNPELIQVHFTGQTAMIL